MSYNFNYKFWVATADQIRNILLRERVFQKLEPTQDESAAHDVFAYLFAKYVSLVNRLSDVYDQTCQVQKRKLVGKLLEAATKRLKELKHELKKIELSEFVYVDKKLVQEKLTPDDIVLLSPYHFPQRRSQEIQDLIDGKVSYETISPSDHTREDVKQRPNIRFATSLNDTKPQPMPQKTEESTISKAVILIKAHEKARKARWWYKNIQLNPEKYKPRPTQEDIIEHKLNFDSGTSLLNLMGNVEYEADDNSKKSHESIQEPYSIESSIIEASTDALDGDKQLQVSFQFVASRTPEQVESYLKDNQPQDYYYSCLSFQSSTITFTSSSKSYNLFSLENAAKSIQRGWKLYKNRKRLHENHLKRLKLIGMIDDNQWKPIGQSEFDIYRERQRSRKIIFDQQFAEVCQDEKNRILQLKGPWIMEDISERIRAWFKEFYDECGDFHPYPNEFEGGTILLLTNETLTTQEFKAELQKKRDKKSIQNKKTEQEKKKSEAEKREAAKEKAKRAAELKKKKEAMQGKSYDFKSDEFITRNYRDIDETMAEYDRFWMTVDEKSNVLEAPFKDWIIADKNYEVHLELIPIVDELMRVEYELLRKALAKDRKEKYKPSKVKKRKKHKKVKSGKKKKGQKDITADKSIHTLFYEMKEAGLIREFEKVKLDDYIGDYNYAAFEQRHSFDMDPQPSKGEVKNILREWLLGAGPISVPKPKSIFISGPNGSGSKYLFQAIATEIDAVVIDISPENAIKFQDDMKYFVHLVSKMAKILQPTVLYIDQAHRLFYKRVPRNEIDLKPKLLGKNLVKKILKPIKKDDKIILIGTSSQPWLGSTGKLKKSFEKILLIPKTDYGTNYLLWRNGVLSKHGVERNFEFSPLATVTRGFQSSNIYNNSENTLNLRRRMNLRTTPLTQEELLEGFFVGPEPIFPVSNEEYEKYLSWFKKIDGFAKKRHNKMQVIQEQKSRKNK